MNSRPVAAVLFDMDETLVTHTCTGLDLTREIYQHFKDHLGEIDEQTFARTLWQKANDLWKMMFDGVLKGDIARPYSFINTLRALRVEDDRLGHAMLKEFEHRLVESTKLFDDSVHVLQTLRDHGIRTGIVTNGYTTLQNRKLNHHGLPDLVDFTLVSETVGFHKPHAGIFQVALGKAGAVADEALMVGDNLWADIKGAVASGIPSVLLDPHGARIKDLETDDTLREPTHVVPTLSDVLPLAGVTQEKPEPTAAKSS